MDIYGHLWTFVDKNMDTDTFKPFAGFHLDHEMLQIISALDEFKGSWKALSQLTPERLFALRRVATIESVGSSTRIEGSPLSDEEVEKLLGGLKINSFHSRAEQEVAGYADVMGLIFESYSQIPLTENYIKYLHGLLLKQSEKDEYHRGNYKKFANHVEAFAPDGGSLGIVFQTATPFDTPRLMEELLNWTNNVLEQNEYHPLLIVGIFVMRFLAIHPFQDGNGRISRVLTTLLLLKNGYEYVPYSSLERVIEENKDTYYRTLRKAQTTLNQEDSGLNEWLLFFLQALQEQKNSLAHKLKRERLFSTLPELSERLLEIAKEHGRITMGMAVTITGANRSTLKSHLKRLTELGYLMQYGKGKGVWYSLT